MKVSIGRSPVLVTVPLLATTSLSDGALIMPGTTADTDLGTAILATNSTGAPDSIGFLKGAYTYASTTTSNLVGTQWLLREVELHDRVAPVLAEYDQTDTMAVASTSGTTVTVTSLEDNIDQSWLYAVSGTGVGKLAFLTASASGSATSKTATSWDSTTVLIKILRFGHPVVKLNAAGTKIGTDAGAGSLPVFCLENWIDSAEYPMQLLNPTIHDNKTVTNARFYTKLYIRNTAAHTID